MVKFYSHSHAYDHPFATVSLAYFLRYPNPYSPHVLSTDVLSRTYDPATGQLSTTRLVLKRSRMPRAILALLPRGLLRANAQGEGQSFILERSVVDIKGGWMRTESRNLELRTVLDVIERQTYVRGSPPDNQTAAAASSSSSSSLSSSAYQGQLQQQLREEKTNVQTSVTLHSRLGQKLRQKADDIASTTSPSSVKSSLLSWSQARLQRSIEAIGLSRTSRSQPNAMEGMRVVLERLRLEGLGKVWESMRREAAERRLREQQGQALV